MQKSLHAFFEIRRGKQKFHQEWAEWWKMCADLTNAGKGLNQKPLE